MEKFFKELSKHYLSVAAAVLIAILIGIIIKEPRINLISILLGAFVYLLFLALSALIYKFSEKIKNNGENDV